MCCSAFAFESRLVILLSNVGGHPRQRFRVVVVDDSHFMRFETKPSANRFFNTAWGILFADLLDVVQVLLESFACLFESVRARIVRSVTMP